MKPIILQEKPFFDRFFKEFPPQSSELTFTNLFVWESKEYLYEIIEDHLIIKSKDYYLQPIGKDPVRIIEKLAKDNKEIIFDRIEEPIAKKVKDLKVIETPENHDYVYSLIDMRELVGDKYAAKRNFIKRFKKNSFKLCNFHEKSIKGALHLQERWCDIRGCNKNPGLHAESCAVKKALEHFHKLDLEGVCVYVDDRIEGFAIGESLNDDTFVEHFEKGDTNFTGIYQFVLNEFAKSISKDFKFLNREQDLGIEGIRKAKKSYYPVKRVKKFRIQP